MNESLDMYVLAMCIVGIIHVAVTLKLINSVNRQANDINVLEGEFDDLHREYLEFRMAHNV